MSKRSEERTEFLKDVLITGVETFGMTPWFRFKDYDPDGGSVKVLEEDYDEDGTVILRDRGTVTVDKIASAIHKIIMDPEGTHARGVVSEIREASAENDAGIMDAWSADAVLQVAALGDVVYG